LQMAQPWDARQFICMRWAAALVQGQVGGHGISLCQGGVSCD
jgi:hypothetical protein